MNNCNDLVMLEQNVVESNSPGCVCFHILKKKQLKSSWCNYL